MKTHKIARLTLLVVLFILLANCQAQAPRAVMGAVAPTTCIPVTDGQVCMAYYQDTETPTVEVPATNTPTPTETATVTLTPTYTPTATLNPNIPYDIEFFINPAAPLLGHVGTDWYVSGAAASSNVHFILGDYLQGKQVVYAKWQVAWNPNSNSYPTGLRLVYTPLLTAGEWTEMGRMEISDYHFPRTNMVIMTDAVQNVLDSGMAMQVTMQAHGDGTNGPLIYLSVLYIVLR